MNKGIPVISASAVERMNLTHTFKKKMEEEGYADPFEHRRLLVREKFNIGSKPTKEEFDKLNNMKQISVEKWKQLEAEFIAREMFKHFGWEYIQGDLEENPHLRNELFPCNDPVGQCNLFCPKFPCKEDV